MALMNAVILLNQRSTQMNEYFALMTGKKCKSFILCLYMKTIRAKQVKVHSSLFLQRDEHGITEHKTQSSILM